jgi:hypothetical protein
MGSAPLLDIHPAGYAGEEKLCFSIPAIASGFLNIPWPHSRRNTIRNTEWNISACTSANDENHLLF